jgi:hypothetical protein
MAEERADMMAHLVKLGCDMDEVIDKDCLPGGGTPLHIAVDAATHRRGRRYTSPWTPLHIAVDGGMIDEVRWLVENGADVLVRNKIGRLPSEPAHLMNEETLELRCLITFYETRYREIKTQYLRRIDKIVRFVLQRHCR